MADRKQTYSPLRTADTADVMAGLFDRPRDRLSDADLRAIEALQASAVATLRALGKVAPRGFTSDELQLLSKKEYSATLNE
jgi:hypothetical protein